MSERLPPSERSRLRKLQRWEDGQASTIGWSLLTELCADRTGGRGEVRREPRGRPYVHACCGELRPDVSLSHSGDYVAAAASQDGHVGVDVETTREVMNGVEELCFTPSELTWLRTGTGRSEKFIRLWTLKEAYVKATGEGMAANLLGIQFEMRGSAAALRVDGKPLESERWQFRSWRLPDAWLSVCVEHQPPPLEFEYRPSVLATFGGMASGTRR